MKAVRGVRRVFGVGLLLLLVAVVSVAGEVYRLQWTQSPSTFLETQKVMAKINGGTEAQLGADLPANVSQLEFEFTTGASVVWRVVSMGDNATTATSTSVTFTAVNMAGILPATGLQQTFVRHND